MAGNPRPVEVDLTVISAKDLKNVNWRYGDLRPYAVAWVDPDIKVSTQVDPEGDTKPSWNEKLIVPVTKPLQDAELTIDIVHEKASDLTKPLVGTARIRLAEILDEVGFDQRQERTLKLKRPSGRPQGKLEIAICVREKRWPQQEYPYPQPYSTRDYAPPPAPQPYGTRDYAPSAPYPYQQYPYGANPPPQQYPYAYDSNPPPQQYPYAYGSNPPPQQYPYGRNPPSGYPSGPYGNPYPEEAPVSYGGSSGYGSGPAYSETEKPKSSKFGVGTGLAVGAVAGVLGGLALAEGADYVEDKIADDVAEKVEDDYADQGGYDDYDGGDDFYDGGDDF
ncbi:hypothetical protein SUGI_0871810 [Cryptomeria japonica]|uniref:protein SRC2 n=1 Tax=Cryptomeria japonica TaxID=3369 RepID=UPI002414C347|nr:protein SRC2 [Cryptomeria japonica]GLJ42101.1 hypothetical protein SUGI_0871810 [Cryptomeria japonica]